MSKHKVEQAEISEEEPVSSSRTSYQTFYADRHAEHWVAGEPARPGESVTRAIKQFLPASVPDEVWRRVEDLVKSSVRQAEPISVYSAKALMSVVTQLVIWIDTLGLPLEPDVVFHPDNIDRFASEGCAHLASGSQHNYRTNSAPSAWQYSDPNSSRPHRCP